MEVDLVIGSAASSGETDFGDLVDLALTASGGVVVHDIYRSAVLEFDSRGQFARRLGRAGQGPGEHDGVMALEGLANGDIVVYSSDGRTITYARDGSYRERRLEWRLAGDKEIVGWGADLVLQTVLEPGTDGSPTRYRYIRVDRQFEGLDSLDLPELDWIGEARPGQPSIEPKKFEVVSRAGIVVTGVSSQPILRFTSWDGERVLRRYAWSPVELADAERSAWERQNEFLRRRSGRPERFPPAPSHKPLFSRFVPSSSGTVWVVLNTPSVGPDPSVPDAIAGLPPTPRWIAPFRAVELGLNGEPIRYVRGQDGFDLRAATGDFLWGYTRGSYGEQYVTRLVVVAG